MDMNFKRFLLVPIFASFSLLAMDGQEQPFRLRDHALPHNSVRAKLDQIFQSSKNVANLKQDSTWVDFNSWHWLVGKLATASGSTQFIAKAATLEPNVPCRHPNPTQPIIVIHGSTQNISRISNALRVRGLLASNNIAGFKVPKIWVYPLSGNDDDLDNPDITDKDVIIVEEKMNLVKSKQVRVPFGPVLSAPVPEHSTRLTQAQWRDLVFLAENNVLDLIPTNPRTRC